MRKQYFFRSSDGGMLAWDVDRLVALSSGLSRKAILISSIRELDQGWAGEAAEHTWRGLLEHIKLIEAADLSYPIILSARGEVMDGMHRVAKAVHQGQTEIIAVQFAVDPAPDHVGLAPEALPY